MGAEQTTQEARILKMVKKVLTDVAKDTFTRPGYKHPLSEGTMQGIRECLSLIAAREHEVAQAAGTPSAMRPRYVDEPDADHARDGVVIPLETSGLIKPKGRDDKA